MHKKLWSIAFALALVFGFVRPANAAVYSVTGGSGITCTGNTSQAICSLTGLFTQTTSLGALGTATSSGSFGSNSLAFNASIWNATSSSAQSYGVTMSMGGGGNFTFLDSYANVTTPTSSGYRFFVSGSGSNQNLLMLFDSGATFGVPVTIPTLTTTTASATTFTAGTITDSALPASQCVTTTSTAGVFGTTGAACPATTRTSRWNVSTLSVPVASTSSVSVPVAAVASVSPGMTSPTWDTVTVVCFKANSGGSITQYTGGVTSPVVGYRAAGTAYSTNATTESVTTTTNASNGSEQIPLASSVSVSPNDQMVFTGSLSATGNVSSQCTVTFSGNMTLN